MPACPRPTSPLSGRRVLLLAAAALALGVAQAQEPTVVKIATNVERSYFPPAEALLRKAYAALGLQVEFMAWPLPRTQVELRSGRIDAVAMRVDAYFEQTPFVRKVDVPLLNLHVYAYGRPPCPNALPAEELARHRISHQRGMVAVEALIPEASRLPANTPSDAFLNLSSGAADFALVLTTPWMAEMPVDTRQGTLCRVPTPLSRTTLFHGVHESHAAWVAPLEQALRAMRDRGEIQQAWADYERQTALQNNRLQAQPGRSLMVTPTTPVAPGSAPAQPPR
jgi:ABC-type amino acid transport substrate-binding protein